MSLHSLPTPALGDEPTGPEPDSLHWDTRLLWASLFVSLAVYAKVPNIDLWVSQRYVHAHTGFIGQHQPWVQWVHAHVPAIGYGLLALGALYLVLTPLLRRLTGQVFSLLVGRHVQRSVIAALLVAGLASGLIVHGLLKETVGRPRPVATVDFGGTEAFVPVFQRGPDPTHHKAFVSGHATTAFCLMALGVVSSPRWRYRWFFLGLVAGSVVGLARVMQGAHYLGDVVFAFHTVWLSCEAVAWFMARPFWSRWLPA